MIASVSGPLLQVGLDRVVVSAGGVGLLVLTTPATAASLRGEPEGTLHTSLVVREDSLTLYGFGSPAERTLFETVQTVSGVGPRLALAMLAVHDPAALVAALRDGDVTMLMRVPGVGRKGAERLVLELRDKMASMEMPGATPAPATPVGEDAHSEQVAAVREALVGLGWSARQAEQAVAAVLGKQDDASPVDVATLLRLSLRELGR